KAVITPEKSRASVTCREIVSVVQISTLGRTATCDDEDSTTWRNFPPCRSSLPRLNCSPPQLRSCLREIRDAIIDSMAQLIVRNLDAEIVTRLRQRAATHGRSTEAEHREILRQVLLPPRRRSSLKEHLLAIPDVGSDRDFERPRDRPRKRVKL